MLTGEQRNEIDKIWNTFRTGGVSNPLTVIEQVTYLLFIKRLDEIQTQRDRQAMLGKKVEMIYAENQQHLRWSSFKHKSPEQKYELFTVVKEGKLNVFEFMKEMGVEDSIFEGMMRGATFMIPTPRLLDMVIEMLDQVKMDDRDTKGDLYEYLLSKIASAGQNGQFRTPRHIIKMMVDMMEPQPGDTVCDPSAGTAGFLVAVGEYMRKHYSELFHKPEFLEHFNNRMFNGVEFDSTMIRIGAMNLVLHGIEAPNLIFKDALSQASADIKNQFSLILANPPFKGSLDYDSVDDSLLKVVKTKKTELLFLTLMLRMLETGGRCAVVVPDGVLFRSNKDYKVIRQKIVEGQKLEAVISMPSGVFKPYAGVSTAILIFTKTNSGGTDKVWFYDMESDGYSLDDKRQPIEANDIPDIITRYKNREAEADRTRTEKSFFVPFKEIQDNAWDLSINRYKEIVYEETEYEAPKNIITQIKQIEAERTQTLKDLEGML